jgi:hypothetical protein
MLSGSGRPTKVELCLMVAMEDCWLMSHSDPNQAVQMRRSLASVSKSCPVPAELGSCNKGRVITPMMIDLKTAGAARCQSTRPSRKRKCDYALGGLRLVSLRLF